MSAVFPGKNFDSLNKIQTPVMDKIKEQFRDTFPSIVADTKAFLKENADQKVGEIKLGQLYGGMRGMPALICETSKLDPERYSFPRIQYS